MLSAWKQSYNNIKEFILVSCTRSTNIDKLQQHIVQAALGMKPLKVRHQLL